VSLKLKSDLPPGQDVYQRILGDIRCGARVPGDRLTEVDLAETYNISRTPVREAMRRLEADGLVEHSPRRGASIRRLDHAEVSELYDMRRVLEGAAAEFAARAASEVELSELAAIHCAMQEAEGTGALYDLNQQFHAALLDAARNRFLVKSVAAIHKTLLILGRSTMEDGTRAGEAIREHAAILDALEARDPLTAGEAMRAHIAAAHRARLQLLRTSRCELDIE
jgi:DNA-binding GntR family transcriptional regulator